MPITLNGDTGITTPMYNGSITANAVTPSVNMKNRIINGAMVIAQRGTSFSFASGGGAQYYAADRFSTQDYHWSAGTNPTISNDTTVYPTGFTNSYKYATGATGLTFNAGGIQYIRQVIEGFNIADCYTGNITISFWVRASTAGQYNICLSNNSANLQRYSTRNYTINSANTWEYKTITVDLSVGIASGGTWGTTNGEGLTLFFMFGAASDRTGNEGLNTWATGGSPSYSFQTTGCTNLATIANSTFYLTGVQVEKGSTATSFDYRPYGTELQLCQRYYQQTGGNGAPFGNASAYSSTFAIASIFFPVTMRTKPTGISTTGSFAMFTNNTSYAISSLTYDDASTAGVRLVLNGTSLPSTGSFDFRASGTATIGFTGAEL